MKILKNPAFWLLAASVAAVGAAVASGGGRRREIEPLEWDDDTMLTAFCAIPTDRRQSKLPGARKSLAASIARALWPTGHLQESGEAIELAWPPASGAPTEQQRTWSRLVQLVTEVQWTCDWQDHFYSFTPSPGAAVTFEWYGDELRDALAELGGPWPDSLIAIAALSVGQKVSHGGATLERTR